MRQFTHFFQYTPILFSARVSRQQHSALPTDECATVYIIMPFMSGRERYVLRLESGISHETFYGNTPVDFGYILQGIRLNFAYFTPDISKIP